MLWVDRLKTETVDPGQLIRLHDDLQQLTGAFCLHVKSCQVYDFLNVGMLQDTNEQDKEHII